MSTVDYLSALESLGSVITNNSGSSNDNNNNNNVNVNPVDDYDDLFDRWRGYHCNQSRNSSSSSSSSNLLLLLPPPPPLYYSHHHHLTNNNFMNAAATTRNAVTATTNNNVVEDSWNAQAQMLLSRWRDYNTPTYATTTTSTSTDNGFSTSRMMMPATTTTAALPSTCPFSNTYTATTNNTTATATTTTSRGEGFASSSSLVPHYAISSSSFLPHPYLHPYHDSNHSHENHRHQLHLLLWQHHHDRREQQHHHHHHQQQQQQHAVSANAEEQIIMAGSNSMVSAMDSAGLERLQLILNIIRGNDSTQLNFNEDEVPTRTPSLRSNTIEFLSRDDEVMEVVTEVGDQHGVPKAEAETLAETKEAIVLESVSSSVHRNAGVGVGNLHANSNAFPLPPIHEEISPPSLGDDGRNDSSLANPTTTTRTTRTATTEIIAHDTIITDYSSTAATPSPSIAPSTSGHPVHQAATSMMGMERISAAAIDTHGSRGGDANASSPVVMTAMTTTTTPTTRLNTTTGETTTSLSSSERRKKKKKKMIAGIIDRPGAITRSNNDDVNGSNDTIDSSNVSSSTANANTPTSFPAEDKEEEGKDPSVIVSSSSSPPMMCCICLEEPNHDELSSIDSCAHPFCFSCIERWADQENTCPLCKSRFHKIDKVHSMTRKRKELVGSESEGKAGELLGGCVDGEEERSSKRVRNRDQRSDALRFGSLEGIFESLESNGTWPTHIAQLLFSGLGASSRVSDLSGADRSTLPAGSGPRPTRRFMTAVSTAHGQSYHRRADNDLLDLTHWNESTDGRRDGASYSTTSRDNSSVPSSYLTGRSSQYRRVGMRSPATSITTTTTTTTTTIDVGARGTIAHPSSPASYSTGTGRISTFDANSSTVATPPTHSNLFTPLEAFSPWSGSSSASTPLLGRGGYEEPAYQHPNAPATRIDAWGNNPFLTGAEEEEEMLSTMSALSPSAYVRSLHRELEQGLGGGAHSQRQDRLGRQYQVNTSRPSSSEATSTTSGSSPLSVYLDRLRRERDRDNQRQNRLNRQYQVNTFGGGATSANRRPSIQPPATSAALNPFNSLSNYNPRYNNIMCPWNNAAGWDEAGRTVETALEIGDSDDDDVVEIIDVEALP